jgi:hypothetical protein
MASFSAGCRTPLSITATPGRRLPGQADASSASRTTSRGSPSSTISLCVSTNGAMWSTSAGSTTLPLSRRPYDAHAAAHDLVRRPGRVELALSLAEPTDVEQRPHLADYVGQEPVVRKPKDLRFLVGRGVAQDELEEEPVELRLGQRENARLLERILGGDHDERRRQAVDTPLDGDVTFLHRLEQRRLRSGRCAVDLVREQDVGEDGARHELRLAQLLHRRADDVGGGCVRRELDPLELHAERARDPSRQQRLRDAGRPLQQHVASRDDRGEQELELVLVADDDLRQLLTHLDPEHSQLQHVALECLRREGHRADLRRPSSRACACGCLRAQSAYG